MTAWMAVVPHAAPADEPPVDRFAVAARDYQEQRWEQAAEAFGDSTRSDDDATRRDAYFFLAECCMELRQFSRASTAFDAYLALADSQSPHWQRALFRVGEAYYLSEEFDQAIPALQRFLGDFPTNPLCAYAHRYLGEAALAASDATAASRHFRAVIDEFPSSPLAPVCRLKLARCHELLDQPTAARDIYRRFLDDPTFGPYCRQRLAQLDEAVDEVMTLIAAGQPEQAEARLREREQAAAAVDVSAQWYALADAFPAGSEGRLRALRAIADRYPESRLWPHAMFRLAQVEFDDKRFADAADRCGSILRQSPSPELMPHVLFLQGQLQAEEEDWSAAGESMRYLVDEFPAHTLAPAATFWCAEAEFRQHHWQSARDAFGRIADQEQATGQPSPRAPMTELRIAQVAAHLGDWEEALERAVGIRDRYPNFGQQFEVDYLRRSRPCLVG